MSIEQIAVAIHRVEAVLRRRPEIAVQEDGPASARWHGGARVVASHPNGMQVSTDLPVELGGTGDQVSPGWLFRAALASCAATSIVMAAATEGIELDALEVVATSLSDTRGLLGMAGGDGEPVHSGPSDLTLRVRVTAAGVDAARLRAMVQAGVRRSPVPNAATHATAIELLIDIDAR